MPLPNICGSITFVSQNIRPTFNIFPQFHILAGRLRLTVRQNPIHMRISTAQKHSPSRRRYRITTYGLSEHYCLFGKVVKMRGLDLFLSYKTHRITSILVCHNDQQIRPLLS